MNEIVRKMKVHRSREIHLCEVTYTVKAVFAFNTYENVKKMAEKARAEVLRECGSEATIDFDDFDPDNWSGDFVPYGNNEREMPLSSYLMIGYDPADKV